MDCGRPGFGLSWWTVSMSRVRLLIHYVGRVQGVGFRATTAYIARHHQVQGSVRNLPDGRVEVDVQGEPPVVDAFLAEVARSFRSRIHDQVISPIPLTDEQAAEQERIGERFIIRY